MRANDTIERVKDLIEEQLGIPPAKQRLIFNSQKLKTIAILEDQLTLDHYGITQGSKLHLVLSLRG